MEVTIKTNPTKYFRQLIEIFGFTPQFSSLTSRERDVWAEIMFYSWQYRTLSPKERWTIIMHPDTKERIRMKLGLSKQSLNNIFASLRKKELVTFTSVNEKYLMVPMDKIIINFRSDAD